MWEEHLCPSLFAKGNDSIKCGEEPAPTIARREDEDCNALTCRGCAMNSQCKFCSSKGDWRCVPTEATCPSGAYEFAAPQTLCVSPRCDSDCAGHGVCDWDQYGEILRGRPTCKCDLGWKTDDKEGCVEDADAVDAQDSKSALGLYVGLPIAAVVLVAGAAVLVVVLRRRASVERA